MMQQKSIKRAISFALALMLIPLLPTLYATAAVYQVYSSVSRDDGIWLFPTDYTADVKIEDWAGCGNNYGGNCVLDNPGTPKHPNWGDPWHGDATTRINATGHNGMDISGVNTKSSVKAAAAGTIVYARNTLSDDRGRYIVIEHKLNDGSGYSYYSVYQHLSKIEKSSGTVNTGDIIGRVGGSGRAENSYGVHLHFAILLGPSGNGGNIASMEKTWVRASGNTSGMILNNPSTKNYTNGGADFRTNWSSIPYHCGSVTYTLKPENVSIGKATKNIITTDISESSYTFKNNADMYLNSGSDSKGGTINTASNSNAISAQWKVTKKDKAYSIVSLASGNGRALNVHTASSSASGNKVDLWDYTGDPSQLWVFEKSGDGGGYIIHPSDNHAIALTAGNSGNITVSANTGNANQIWYLDILLDTDAPTVPTPVHSFGNTISAAYFNVYAIQNDGSLWSWSGGQSKQILSNVCSVKGDYAITSDGSLWELRKQSDHTHSASRSPVKIMSDVADITVYPGGMDTTDYMGILKKDGSLWVTSYLWSSGNRTEPVKIFDSGVATVETGGDFLVVLTEDSGLWIWDEAWGDERIPRAIKIMENVSMIGVNSAFTVYAIEKDHSLWAWSYADYAYDGGSGTSNPIRVMNGAYKLFNWTGFTTDAYNTLWEIDFNFDDSFSISSPKVSKTLESVKEVLGNGYSGKAIQLDGTMWEWDSGNAPKQIETDITHIEEGLFYFTYVKKDGSLWVYGRGVPGMEINENPTPIKIFNNVVLSNQYTSSNINLENAASWAYEGITSAVEMGFVPYDLQNSYTNTITRQEFCRMAVQWLEYKTGKSIDTILTEQGKTRNLKAFSDTSDSDILAAFALGITNGTVTPSAGKSGTFTPNGSFTREQAATMIRNTCKAAGMDVSNISNAGFTDISAASSWAIDGINFVRNTGIMGGTSTASLVFSPKGIYSRQESIVAFDRIP